MRIKDMTQGPCVKLILTFALPLFIGNIFQQIYNLVDTAVVGHCIGDSAISAIGTTSSLYILLISLVTCLNSGYAIITTQSFGARDESRIRKCIAGTILLNAGATLVITVLAVMFLQPLLVFMNTPESVFEDAYRYIMIICVGMFSTVGYNMFAGILRAVGNSRTPLYCLIVSSVINVGLDILFVAGFRMGVSGAALATVLAQIISAILCGIAFFRNYLQYIPKKGDFRVPRELLSNLLTTGVAMALMMCVVHIGTLVFQRANNALGEDCITAYATGRRVVSLVMQPLSTLAEANSTFVSQNWGAKKPARIKDALKKMILIEILWSLFSCVVIFLFGKSLVFLITGTESPQILSDSVLCMRATIPFFPVLGVLLCLRTAMQAMGRKTAPVISSCVELALKAASAVWLIPRVGFVGSCFTEPVTWVFMTAFLVLAYFAQRKNIYKQIEFTS